ncbi:MAG: Efflux transporter periplasmic adaptor subunit [Acidobacteria bacterium]|nr:Efflux transporter periplasmic adaptor subunit [Acidobacteriota bacterium]
MTMRALRQFGGGLAAAASLLALAACQTTKAAVPGAPPPLDVSVAAVVEQPVTTASEWIATLDGYVNAQIRPQVSGYLVTRRYREGAAVHRGDVLFEIDPRPLQAVLTQATAQAAQAEAQLAKSARDVERDTPLASQQAIAQSQLDADIQAWRAAKANVDALEAAVETARLNVSFTSVTSLIDGVAAIATAQIGDLVGPATLLTTVSQVSPIKAYFAVSELEYLRIAGAINGAQSGRQPWDSQAGLSLTLSDGRIYPHKGTFVAADREVDRGTGTIRLVAAFPNPGNLLRPGQYGRVRALTGTDAHALVVPQRAVSDLQGGYQIRVLGPGNHVTIRTVTVGDRVGNLRIITSGATAGEQVIVGAPAAVRDGSIVTPKPYTHTEG